MVKAYIAKIHFENKSSEVLYQSFYKRNNLIKYLKEELGYKEISPETFEKINGDGEKVSAVISVIEMQDPYFY